MNIFMSKSIFSVSCFINIRLGLPSGTSGKDTPTNAGDITEVSLISGFGKIPCRRAWQPTPVFLPGESHIQRSLVGYSS